MYLIQAREDPVSSRNGSVVCPRAQPKHRHVCRYSCADANEAVFNNDTISWRNAKMLRGRQEKARVRLPRSNFVPAEYLAGEVRIEIGGLQVFLDLLPGTAGRVQIHAPVFRDTVQVSCLENDFSIRRWKPHVRNRPTSLRKQCCRTPRYQPAHRRNQRLLT